MEHLLAESRKLAGAEVYSYWEYLVEDGTAQILEDHWESFHTLVYAEDPILWRKHLAPRGAFKSWILGDMQGPLASYLTEQVCKFLAYENTITESVQDRAVHRKAALEGGLDAPLNWYRVITSGINAEDERCKGQPVLCQNFFADRGSAIPLERYEIKQPVFFGGAKRDYVCLSAMGKEIAEMFCGADLTTREFDAGHWLMLSAADEVNKALLDWIRKLTVS